MLAQAWPDLQVIVQARNGREAVEQFEAQQPDICFLDVHMPGLSGVEAARCHGEIGVSTTFQGTRHSPRRHPHPQAGRHLTHYADLYGGFVRSARVGLVGPR